MKNLSDVRKGEIALIILKDDIMRKAQTLNRTDVIRKINQVAEQLKDQGVTKDDLMSLYKDLIEETVKKLFPS